MVVPPPTCFQTNFQWNLDVRMYTGGFNKCITYWQSVSCKTFCTHSQRGLPHQQQNLRQAGCEEHFTGLISICKVTASRDLQKSQNNSISLIIQSIVCMKMMCVKVYIWMLYILYLQNKYTNPFLSTIFSKMQILYYHSYVEVFVKVFN